jgi:hypothetical protein
VLGIWPRSRITLDRQLPAGAAGPDPGMEPAAPDDRPPRVRGLLQHAPATPNPEPKPHRSARCPMASLAWATSASSGATAPEA